MQIYFHQHKIVFCLLVGIGYGMIHTGLAILCILPAIAASASWHAAKNTARPATTTDLCRAFRFTDR